MLLSLGDYQLSIREFSTKSEQKIFLDNCKLNTIEIESDWAGEDRYYLIICKHNNDDWAIELTNSDTRDPILLIDSKNLALIIGLNNAIYFVDVSGKKIISKIDITGDIIYQFHSLHHIGVSEFFIVDAELSVFTLNFSGNRIWEYRADDIINYFELKDEHIIIKTMSSEDKLYLNLYTGKPHQTNNS